MKRAIPGFLLFAVILAAGHFSYAAEQGHYYPGAAGVRDLVMPPKGFYVTSYNFLYFSRGFKDSDGKDVKQLSRTATGSRAVNIGSVSIGNMAPSIDSKGSAPLLTQRMFFDD